MRDMWRRWSLTIAGLCILFILWISYHDLPLATTLLLESGTLVRNKDPDCNIFFVHITKHGGTAVCELLRNIP